jgi:tol-pal system protein YbgF
MKYFYLVSTVMMVCLSGCVTQSALDNVHSDIDAVKTRLISAERNLTGVREESKESVSSVAKDFKGDVAAVRKMSADIQATIDGTRGEMQALNGKLDDALLTIKKPAEDLARYREDADKRIIALEDRILKQQTLLEDFSKRLEELVKAKKEEPAAAPVTPDALYMKGLETYKTGAMSAARELFAKFIEQNPRHDLAANAHYWIGETHYSEKNYEAAILAYQEVIKNYPGKEKVAAAMLKQAMSFSAIKDNKSAKYVLKKLVESFPKSEEAKRAKELLNTIK